MVVSNQDRRLDRSQITSARVAGLYELKYGQVMGRAPTQAAFDPTKFLTFSERSMLSLDILELGRKTHEREPELRTRQFGSVKPTCHPHDGE